MRVFWLFFFIVSALVVVSIVFADTTGTLRPTADGGDDSANWTNTSGTACNATNCYTEVDESSGSSCTNSDGDTTYIQSAKTSGISQTFDIDESSITDDSTVTQIDITVCYAKSGGGGTFQTRYCHNGSCSDSGINISTGAAYAEATQSHAVSFTKTSGSDIEIGVTNTAAKNTRISQIAVAITYTAPSDTTAPAAVTDLAASDATATTIKLSWTSPGDDGSTGTATSYDIRYSTAEITSGNWASATTVTGEPTPSVAGSSETYTVTGLSAETTYYFALKTSDEVPNESGLSNVPSLATTATADTTAPAAVTDLALSGATASAINLAWTAPGDDGSTGTASSYDVRYSTATITDANWSSATTVTGEPTPSLSETSESMTVSGLVAETTYYFALKTSDEASNESGLSNIPTLATSAAAEEPSISIPSGYGSSGTPSTVRFSGQAYPESTIEILRKGSKDELYVNIPVSDYVMNDDGTFRASYLGLISGDYFFALRAEDKDGRKTGIFSFNVDLIRSNLKVEDIFIPPTVGFGSVTVKKGNDVEIVGYAGPENMVELEIDSVGRATTTADATGFWSVSTSTKAMKIGSHYIRARQTDSGDLTTDPRQSNFSTSRVFKVTTLDIPKADFNSDNEVNITDWSVFLFRWGSEDKDLRTKIDLSEDGKIDIVDFSLFLKAMRI